MRAALSSDPRSGSALLIVLGVMAVLSLLVAGFGRGLKADLTAARGFYEEAQNEQLALSALAAAKVELAGGGSMYADAAGDVFFVTDEESYESGIELLSLYRQGIALGRGRVSYRFLIKPFALDINELSAAALGRLFETACGMEEGDERSGLVDAILDWRDADDIQRDRGAEEEFYRQLDTPRHCRNDAFSAPEELLLVNGMTPELLYGRGHPAAIENGMLLGGGLCRFLIGDNCPEAQASVQYILRGVLPAEADRRTRDEAEPEVGVYEKITVLPPVLYLAAEGFVPAGTGGEENDSAEAVDAVPGDSASRHVILVKLVLPENGESQTYIVDDLHENAAGELLDRVLAYGIPEEENEL